MIKYILPLVLIVSACGSSETTPFCECVNASEALNDAQVELMDSNEEIANADPKKMEKLREQKEKTCKEFETVSATEALALKKECEESN